MLTTFLCLFLLALALVAVPRMADLAAPKIHKTAARAATKAFVVADGVTLHAGALVGLNAAGFLAKWSDTAGHKFLGVLLQSVTGNTSASPPVEGIVDVSGVTLKSVTIAGTFVQADLNALIYCATDNSADAKKAADTNVEAIGWASRFHSAGVGDITLFTPEEHQALNA